jgi:hypothetical protein
MLPSDHRQNAVIRQSQSDADEPCSLLLYGRTADIGGTGCKLVPQKRYVGVLISRRRSHGRALQRISHHPTRP